MSVPVNIPLAAVPSQEVTVQLGAQSCRISVYQKTFGMFLDLSVGGNPIITGRICRNAVFLVRSAYLGFSGDIAFVDTQGSSDPEFSGFGSRYLLLWVAP